jgi:HSP20 family protein
MMARDPANSMWAEACAILEQVEQLRRQFFRPGLAGMEVPTWEPPADVFETPDALSIVAALPGIEPQHLDVSIVRDVLVIAGIRHLPAAARQAAIRRLEIPYGRFERHIRLPAGHFGLDRPELKDGCLFVTLTKVR